MTSADSTLPPPQEFAHGSVVEYQGKPYYYEPYYHQLCGRLYHEDGTHDDPDDTGIYVHQSEVRWLHLKWLSDGFNRHEHVLYQGVVYSYEYQPLADTIVLTNDIYWSKIQHELRPDRIQEIDKIPFPDKTIVMYRGLLYRFRCELGKHWNLADGTGQNIFPDGTGRNIFHVFIGGEAAVRAELRRAAPELLDPVTLHNRLVLIEARLKDRS